MGTPFSRGACPVVFTGQAPRLNVTPLAYQYDSTPSDVPM